ncbi:hypothetical protein D3C74_474860 [compost metagenome]
MGDVSLGKCIKQLFDLMLRNANSRITYREYQFNGIHQLLPHIHLQLHFTLFRELDRITQQIIQYLPKS